MRICLISAALPPALDGIGDYTANLAVELARRHCVTVLCGRSGADPVPGCEVGTAFDAARIRSVLALPDAIAGLGADWVVLQYCPFSYGRWGFNPYLILALRRLKRKSPGVRLAVTVHEPMAWPINWKLRTMNLWQGPQLHGLVRISDMVLLVVGVWRSQYARWLTRSPTSHLPVGSNIPRYPIERVDARERLAIGGGTTVLGIFGQGHHSQSWEFAAKAADGVLGATRDALVVHLGPGSERAKSLFGALPVRSDGFLPADEVSRRLSAVDVFLSPFADGVSTRRTTLMAALQHGLPTVGTSGDATDVVLSEADGRALVLTPAGDAAAFCDATVRLALDAGLRAEMGMEASHLYEREFAWPVIARRLEQTLAGYATDHLPRHAA